MSIFNRMLSLFLMTLLLSIMTEAAIAGCDLHTPQKYTVNYTFPIQNPDPNVTTGYSVVLRYYQAWGDGSSKGWQQPVTTPSATIDGNELFIYPTFSYTSSNYNMGGMGLGEDQYAQYFNIMLPYEDISNKKLQIHGTFEKAAYISATIYKVEQFVNPNNPDDPEGGGYLESQESILDKNMASADENCNPYQENNPSVFAYHSPEETNKTLTPRFTAKNNIQTDPLKELAKLNLANPSTGKIGIFRLDRTSSMQNIAEDIAPDGCSRAYLFGKLDSNHEVAILRIKMPTTFIDNNTPDKIFKKYQTRYLSVGAHYNYYFGQQAKQRNFWTVNSQMLNKQKDKEGYVYVFFAPDEYTDKIAKEQNLPATQPPLITWGDYTGYLLGYPEYAIILRYRAPDADWIGNPENAQCYANPAEIKPINKHELGLYTPEIFGGTLDEFINQGNIGSVDKNHSWPNDS